MDSEGDYPFRWGTAQCYVSLDDTAEYVRVWAFAAQIPKGSLKLLLEINVINERARTARVYWSGGWLVTEQSVPVDAVSVEVLGQACTAVGVLADDIGVLLAAMFGGETPFAAVEVEEQENH